MVAKRFVYTFVNNLLVLKVRYVNFKMYIKKVCRNLYSLVEEAASKAENT